MKKLLASIGIAALLALPAAAAGATTTWDPSGQTNNCYTGCTPPTTTLTVTSGPGPAPTVTPTVPTGGLAFTGADLGEIGGVGLAAIAGGTLFVVAGRKRRSA
jgi:hypothetical protein